MIYGYIRVSTDKQTDKNQRFEIETFCNRHSIAVDKWIEEAISGTKDKKQNTTTDSCCYVPLVTENQSTPRR